MNPFRSCFPFLFRPPSFEAGPSVARTGHKAADAESAGRQQGFLTRLLVRFERRRSPPPTPRNALQNAPRSHADHAPSARSTRSSSQHVRAPGERRESTDPDDLQRFIKAQQPVMKQVLSELAHGKKRSHWMWFVFPQVAGLGKSAQSKKFAIHSKGEARAYLANKTLRDNLLACLRELNHPRNSRFSAARIFGDEDARKLHSSLTMISWSGHQDRQLQQEVSTAMQRLFGGRHDSASINFLNGRTTPSPGGAPRSSF